MRQTEDTGAVSALDDRAAAAEGEPPRSRFHLPGGLLAIFRPLLKPFVFVICLLPVASLVANAIEQNLGANPVETITDWSGQWTIRMLLITLTMSPLRQLSGWRWPVQIRRMLGLFTFFYACVHFLAFIWFDHAFLLSAIVSDIVKRPFVTAGFMSWVLLLILAATSNDYVVRRLRRGWQRLHRGVYIVALAAIVHYVWLVKADYLLPMVYLGVCLLLFLFRLVVLLR